MINRRILLCLNPFDTNSLDKNDELYAAYLAATDIAAKIQVEIARGYPAARKAGINLSSKMKGDCHCMFETTDGGRGVKLLRILITDDGEQKGQTLVTTENIGTL